MKRMISVLMSMMAVMAMLNVQAHAQGKKVETDEERTKRCPEGQYSGPYEGARRFYQDPYVWFVSPEFAKRFCMPDSYIDESLKGALALAVRLKNEEFTLCGFVGGPGQCSAKQKLLIDVYIDNRKVSIPKADPSVKFYTERVANSGWIMGTGNARSDRRRKGEITEVEGERRPFAPISERSDAERMRTYFIFMGARESSATGASDFLEDYYRENWVEGIDLITLHGYLLGFQEMRNPDQQVQTERRGGRGYAQQELDSSNPIKHWAIGIINGPKYFNEYKSRTSAVPYPGGFDHVIVVPHKVAQIIYQFDWKQGEIFFNSVKNAIQSTDVSSK